MTMVNPMLSDLDNITAAIFGLDQTTGHGYRPMLWAVPTAFGFALYHKEGELKETGLEAKDICEYAAHCGYTLLETGLEADMLDAFNSASGPYNGYRL